MSNLFIMEEKKTNQTYKRIIKINQEMETVFLSGKTGELYMFLEETVKGFSPVDVWKYRFDYARWFVNMSLDRFMFLSKEEVYKLIENYLFLTLMSGYNVLPKILYYLSLNLKEEKEAKDFFKELKNKIENSKAICGLEEKTIITLGDLYKKYTNNKDSKSFKKNIEQILENNENVLVKKYFLTEKNIILERLEELFDFFLNTEESGLEQKINKFLNSNIKFEPDLKEENMVKISQKITKEEQKITTTPTHAEIKDKILQFFPKDESGEIIDTEGVFEVLEKTANKYNDEKIKELYYYNEATGKFEWGV